MIEKIQRLQKLSKQEWLMVLTGLSVAVLIISNIASVKLTQFGPAIFDAGTVLFPLAYILTDIITEIYGNRVARNIVLIGFGCLLLTSVTLLFVQYLPEATGYDAQGAYERVLGFVPRIVLASMTAYLLGEFLNIYVFSKLKDTFKNNLWGRIIGGSGVGELIDTIIFSTIAFLGVVPFGQFVTLVVTVYLIKLAVNIILSPLTIKTIRYIQKAT